METLHGARLSCAMWTFSRDIFHACMVYHNGSVGQYVLCGVDICMVVKLILHYNQNLRSLLCRTGSHFEMVGTTN